MKRVAIVFTSVPSLVVLGAAYCQDQSDALTHAKTIAPYVESDTILVARVDLAQIDTGAILDEAANLMPNDTQELANARLAEPLLDALIAQLRVAGARELFVVAALEDMIAQQPYVIVPFRDGGNPRRIAGVMFSGNVDGPTSREEAEESGRSDLGFEICRPLDDVVFCGSQATLDRLRGTKRAPMSELVAPMKAAGDGALQVVVRMPKDIRRVVAEMLPRLPQQWGGISGAEIDRGFRWASAGVQLPPRLSAHLTIQCSDVEAARTLGQSVGHIFGYFASQPAVRKDLPNVDRLVELLSPKVTGNRLVLAVTEKNGSVPTLRKLLRDALARAHASAARIDSMNRLRSVGLAIANFESAMGGYPPAASYDTAGRKLLSWRVYVLPFLGQKELYEQFHLDEPWDSEHNKKLIAKMPDVFKPANDASTAPGKTTYLAPLGDGTIFQSKAGIHVREVTDGISKTILLVEVDPAHAVVWTKPDDLQVDFQQPLKGLLGNRDGFTAVYADVSVRVIPKDIPTETLRRLLIRNDGKPVEGY